ncbi:GntR family transcriptional regulator [Leptothrix discophora]|uniref:GntR family transcriptional regulator n=1 Tax=Leptothrix discophora TaxID=89 RepID=A0ABT9FYI4_LEPDI|nr:GntR family transcriptional regulator [Leptothrix discophora]MDP4299284.1 GntR family transcriptional regulator [Leptothrix discophora]
MPSPASVASAPALPVYRQVAELLARQIRAGYWHEGERLPPEAELAVTLQVAVGTLRKALALLAEQELLERVQGSGTYVKRVSRRRRLYELLRLELRHTGPGLPTARVLDVARLARPAELPAFGGPPCDEAWRVRRLRLLSGEPVALEEIWFSGARCDTLSAEELGDSMYGFYQQRFQLWIARVEDRLGAAPAPDWAAPPFGLRPGESAGHIERIAWTAGNAVAECSQTWFDPARCCYTSRLSQ